MAAHHEAGTIRLALSQRVCPAWRSPLFRKLADQPGIRLTLFYGRGSEDGASVNDLAPKGFHARRLWTLRVRAPGLGRDRYRVVHPALFAHLVRGRYDVVMVEGSTNIFNAFAALAYCLVSRRRLVWMEYGQVGQHTKARRLIDPLVRLCVGRSAAAVAFFETAQEQLVAYGLQSRRIVRVVNTMDVEAEAEKAASLVDTVPEIRAKLGLREDEQVVLYLGSVERRKRLGTLIAAAATLRSGGMSVRLVVVGDGPDRAAIEENLSSSERASTVFVGAHMNDAAAYILLSNIVVLPGQGGMAICHAFACGRPVIATHEAWVGGDSVLEYVEDGVNGSIVEAGDTPGLSAAIGRVLSDRTLLQRLESGAQEAAGRLTLERMAEGLASAARLALDLSPGES